MDASQHQTSEDPASDGRHVDDDEALEKKGASGPDTIPTARRSEVSATASASLDHVESEDFDRPDRGTSIVPFVTLGDGARTSAPSDSARRRPPRNFVPTGLAAALGCLVLIGAGVEYSKSRDAARLAAKFEDSQTLAAAVNNLRSRLDAIEAARGREETTDLRKVLGELKSTTVATRDIGASLAQLSSRVDHVEKDQSARLDKLGERLDHDNSARMADIAARIDKIDKKAAPIAVASAAPAAPTPPSPPPKPTQAPTLAKADPGISYEPTGSIDKEKQRPRLHGYAIEDVRDGFAIVETRFGPQQVTAGDFIPGAGRVLRIERQGRDWMVVTTLGVIASDIGPY